MSDCNHENYFMNENCYVCDLESEIQQLEARLKDAESVIDMVEDNRKMPHQHKDYYERLCCLSQRANEYKQKYKLSTNESSE